MKYVLIGKIVSTHGIKGEIKILTSFKYIKKALIPGMNVYIGKDKQKEKIVTYRHHKIFEMITLEGYDNINQILKYKGEYIFVNKEDIKLSKNEYLDEDIIGLSVYKENTYVGNIKKIENHNGNEVLYISNEQKNYLVPYNFDIITDINLKEKTMKVKNIIGMFD